MAKRYAKTKATKARSSAAQKGWETRRANERAAEIAAKRAARKRAESARKAWETRRKNERAAELAAERRREAARRAWAARREREAAIARKRSEAAKRAWKARHEREKLARQLQEERAARKRAEQAAKQVAEEARKAAEAFEREIERAIEKDRKERERARKEKIEARRKREEEEREAVIPWPPPVDSAELLERARERTSRGQQVENVRVMPLRNGGFAIVGNIRDDQGKAIRVRGYEIWIAGERYFYWGLRDVVGRFHPPTAFEHYIGSDQKIGAEREAEEHMVLAWDEAS